MLTAPEIRKTFIDFFVNRCGHTFAPSSPVVPHDDPTLLFTNAGMNQFKDVFLGRGTRPYTRAVNSQKCIRAGGKHNDLEDVGRDTYHHTFFEMLGNWSFGDYFKEEAIAWAWELLTEVYRLPADRLYATYFEGSRAAGLAPDDEVKGIWERYLPANHVLPGNMKDNFWEMGETGPCGPCTEIHCDRIGGRNAAKLVNTGDPNVLEIWNNVFIQFNREQDRSLKPLPAKHVDTGMGLERLVSVLQGRMSNYDTDVFSPLFDAIQRRMKSPAYSGSLESHVDTAYRVIADHIRCLTVALTDGATPSNEGRGYVLRRILRRAVRHGHQTLNVKEPFLCDLVPAVVGSLAEAFPELKKNPSRVAEIIRDEELSFGRTLDRGLVLFDDAARNGASKKLISGDDAFKLHDTYGFPVDLTQVMAEERGLTVDVAGYEALMEQAREASRKAGAGEAERFDLTPDSLARLKHMGVEPTKDVDKYHGRPVPGVVRAIWNGKDFDQSVSHGRTVAIILDRTNFYAESGGQIGDRGHLMLDASPSAMVMSPKEVPPQRSGGRFDVSDTHSIGGYVLHVGTLHEGAIHLGDTLICDVLNSRRELVRGNHTGTHLLNHALREVLGDEVDQKGSLVADDRLRFDFSCPHAMTPEQISKVESLVNSAIGRDAEVFAELAPLEIARRIHGLRAVFGERYPDPVRVVSIGVPVRELLSNPENARWRAHSIEFCGGTHLASTGGARRFLIASESALSAGVRRIIALTGPAAMAADQAGTELEARAISAARLPDAELLSEFEELGRIAESLSLSSSSRNRLHDLMEKLRERVKGIRKQQQAGSREQAVEVARGIAEGVQGRILVKSIAVSDRDGLLAALDTIRARRPEAAVMLLGADEEKVTIVAAVPKEAIDAGLKAGDWVKEAAAACGGSGGGKPDRAQAGGKDPSKVGAAVDRAMSFAESLFARQAAGS